MLLKTLVILTIIDYGTGCIKGIYKKQLSSEIGFKGILKKIVILTVVAVGYAIQHLMQDAMPIREMVIMFYICNEALSILENAAEIIPVPDKLREVLLQLRENNNEGDE